MKVEVKPIPEIKWHGKKGAESFTQPKTIEVLYDPETGKYATGLTKEQAEKYGIALGGVSLSDTFIYEQPHPFYSTKAAFIKLENVTMTFNTERAMDFVKVAAMKASKKVANNMKEFNEGLWPEASHVIYDESEEVDAKATKIQQRKAADRIADKMNEDQRISTIQIIRGKSYRGKSPNFITVEIEDIIETQLSEFMRIADMGPDRVYILGCIKEAIHRGILNKEGGSVFYMGEMIGIDESGAVDFFLDSVNQKMKLSIFDRLTTTKAQV